MTEIIGASRDASASARRHGAGRVGGGRHQLVVDPRVRLLHALRERGARLPVEPLLDPRVVGVPPADALRRVDVVTAGQPGPRGPLPDVPQLGVCHELGGPPIDWGGELALPYSPPAAPAGGGGGGGAGRLPLPPPP